MLRNEEGYTDPTADKVFSSVLKKPTLSEQDAKSLSRIKHLMHLALRGQRVRLRHRGARDPAR